MEDYVVQFMSGEEGAPRAAVKRLTAAIERELTQSTINAPDWLVIFFLFIYSCLTSSLRRYRDTLYAARMARDLLWPEERSINLDEFVTISQTYVELPAIHPVILGRAETVRAASSTSSLLPTSFRTFTLSEDTC